MPGSRLNGRELSRSRPRHSLRPRPAVRNASKPNFSSRSPCVRVGRRIRPSRRLVGFHLGRRGVRSGWNDLGWRGATRAAGALASRGDHTTVYVAWRRLRCPRAVAQCACHVLGGRNGLGEFQAGDQRLAPRLDTQAQLSQTSSIGRLFDGAAALLGLVSQASYEGAGREPS
jgi:hypothetical protein